MHVHDGSDYFGVTGGGSTDGGGIGEPVGGTSTRKKWWQLSQVFVIVSSVDTTVFASSFRIASSKRCKDVSMLLANE